MGFYCLKLIHRYFDHPTGNRLGLYAASLYIPSIPAAFLGDILADRFGRRIAIYVGSVIVIAGSLVNSLAIHIPMWIVGKYSLRGCEGALTSEDVQSLASEEESSKWRLQL